ncbi:MAG: hypothetical protein IJQ49_05315 [Prevotella sp.]|nr:hypothetical protein [Prevotella sp.]
MGWKRYLSGDQRRVVIRRDAIRTAYFSVVELTSPILPLKTDDFRRLRELMQMMIHYQQMGLPLSNDSLRMLYNLFLTDLSTVQQHSIREHRFPKRVEEIFLGFLGLLPQHFAEHHLDFRPTPFRRSHHLRPLLQPDEGHESEGIQEQEIFDTDTQEVKSRCL